MNVNNDEPEHELQERMIKYLGKYFFVEDEVWSTDGEKRIDIIVVHKKDLDKKYPIGIEIKRIAKKRGKDLAEWLKQSSVYSSKLWVNYGKCLIVTCPQVSGYYLREGELMSLHETDEGFSKDNNVSTFLGQFGIGEFQKYARLSKVLYRIVFKGQIIWDQNMDSLRTNNYDRLCR